ncbi:MAG: hypothetical protein JO306_01690 [Gemmatimonadetes bacterium]|nr:hypothetical protein [Gemmatimonadota bacterium]
MDEQFYITFPGISGTVVQAGHRAGLNVTLAPMKLAEPLQLWNLEPQVAAGLSGVAFVNQATGLSIFYQGAPGLPLIMQPYTAGTDGMGAWYVTAGSGAGDVQITLPTDPKLDFIAPARGIYHFDLSFLKDALQDGGTDDDVYVDVEKFENGAWTLLGTAWSGEQAGKRGTGCVSFNARLKAGDRVTTRVRTEGGFKVHLKLYTFAGHRICSC